MTLSEQSAIGSILIDAAALPALRAEVSAADFADDAARALFTAACELADGGEVVDAATITARAGASSELVVQLMSVTPSAAAVRDYGRAVHRERMARDLQALGASLIGCAERDVGAELARASRELENIGAGLRSTLGNSGEVCAAFFAELEQLRKGERSAGVSSGYKQLDTLLGGGFIREGLYILAARPAVGKSTVALNIAARCRNVLFVSLEMSGFQVMSRLASMHSGIPIARVINGKIADDETEKITAALATISQAHIAVSDNALLGVDDVAALARGVDGLQLVVVDYLGLLRCADGRSIYEKITFNSNALKRLARSLGVPVLCLAQLNRASEQRGDKSPMLSDLRDSGAIEQDADGVLLLHDLGGDDRRTTLEINLAKNRHGATGRLEFDFFRWTGRVIEK